MDHEKVGIFQEADQIVLCSFPQSQDHVHLEVQVIFTNFLGNFVDQMWKGALAYEEFSALLELAISWRATIPSWYLWDLLSSAAFRNSLHGALPPTVGQSILWVGSFPADVDGPASAAICASWLVGDDPCDCPTFFSLLASSLCLSTSPRIGDLLLCLGLCSGLGLVFHPALGVSFILAMLEWKINQSEVLVGISEHMHHFFIHSMSTEILGIFDKWQKSGAIFHTFWRGRRRSFRHPWG